MIPCPGGFDALAAGLQSVHPGGQAAVRSCNGNPVFHAESAVLNGACHHGPAAGNGEDVLGNHPKTGGVMGRTG